MHLSSKWWVGEKHGDTCAFLITAVKRHRNVAAVEHDWTHLGNVLDGNYVLIRVLPLQSINPGLLVLTYKPGRTEPTDAQGNRWVWELVEDEQGQE